MKTLGESIRERMLENFSGSFKYALKVSDFSDQKFAEIAGLDISRFDDIKKGAEVTNMEYLAIASVFDHVTYSDEAVYKAVVKILTPDDYKITSLDDDANFILVSRWLETFNHDSEPVNLDDDDINDDINIEDEDEPDDDYDDDIDEDDDKDIDENIDEPDDEGDGDSYERTADYHYSEDALSDEELEILTSDQDCAVCADVTALKDENFPALIHRLNTGLLQSGKKIVVSELALSEMADEIQNCSSTPKKLALEHALKYVNRLYESGLIEIAGHIDMYNSEPLASVKDIIDYLHGGKAVFITQDIERAKFAAAEYEDINTYHVNDRGDLVFWGNFGM